MPYSRLSDVFIHVFAGLAFMMLPLLFMSGQAGNDGIVPIVLSTGYWGFCLTYIFIFYLNTYWLIPGLYFKRKYLFYVAIVRGLFILIAYARPFELLLQHHRPHPTPPLADMLMTDRLYHK